MRPILSLALVLVPAAAAAQSSPSVSAACDRLASLSLPNTTITLTQVVNAGAFAVPVNPTARGGGGSSALAGTLGPVPTDTFDMLGVIRRWVERGEAPKAVIASRVERGKVVRTRPLCPYPQVAAYRGKGSTDDARNFVCK